MLVCGRGGHALRSGVLAPECRGGLQTDAGNVSPVKDTPWGNGRGVHAREAGLAPEYRGGEKTGARHVSPVKDSPSGNGRGRHAPRSGVLALGMLVYGRGVPRPLRSA